METETASKVYSINKYMMSAKTIKINNLYNKGI